jgi:hypothetical protein
MAEPDSKMKESASPSPKDIFYSAAKNPDRGMTYTEFTNAMKWAGSDKELDEAWHMAHQDKDAEFMSW